MNKHLRLLYENVDKSKIITAVYGNNRAVGVTKDTVYIASKGISTGAWTGKKVKSYPIDQITSIDITRKMMVNEFEIVTAGTVEQVGMGNFTNKSQNENIIMFPKKDYKFFKQVADKINELKAQLRKVDQPSNNNDFAGQIEKLSKLREQGILTEEEFKKKKEELLAKI